jgi:hypothetical protein
MPTHDVVLNEHRGAFGSEIVLSGQHSNASEVLRERQRLMERRELLEAAKVGYLWVQLGAAERDALANRPVTYGSGVFDDVDE